MGMVWGSKTQELVQTGSHQLVPYSRPVSSSFSLSHSSKYHFRCFWKHVGRLLCNKIKQTNNPHVLLAWSSKKAISLAKQMDIDHHCYSEYAPGTVDLDFCLFWFQSIESSKFGSSETHRNPTTGYRTCELFVSKRVPVLKGTKKLLVTRSYSDMSLFFSQSTSPSQKDLLHTIYTIYNDSSSHKPK